MEEGYVGERWQKRMEEVDEGRWEMELKEMEVEDGGMRWRKEMEEGDGGGRWRWEMEEGDVSGRWRKGDGGRRWRNLLEV